MIVRELARGRIGDFSEDGGPLARRCGRKVRWPLMKCFVGHKGEGEGFFGGGGDAEVVGRDDLDGGCRKTFEIA